MADSYYDGLWDEIETPEPEEIEVSKPLVQVGGDHPPTYPLPEGRDRAERYLFTQLWGRGEPVVTPRLRAKLGPGELELYVGALARKLTLYAWTRVQSYGTGIVDPEALVQEALISRWMDDRELEPRDVERFAINQVKQASIKLSREMSRRTSGPEDEFDPQLFSARGRMLRADENPYAEGDYVTGLLSEGSWAWIQYHLSDKAAEAVRLVLEDQYTQAEAARAVGLRQGAVSKAFKKLKEEASDQGKE